MNSNQRKTLLLLAVFFLIMIGLAAAGILTSDQREPVRGQGVPKIITETELTNPNKIPSVAPGAMKAGIQEREYYGPAVTMSPGVNNRENPRGKRAISIQAGPFWGKDIFASSETWPISEDLYGISLASHSNGRIYIAYEADAFTGERYIAIDVSADGGLTWSQAGWAWQTGKNLTDSSIAVTDDSIVVAYVVDDGVNDPYIEVSNEQLTAQAVAFSARSVLHSPPNNELDPFIFTDYHIYPTSSSVYLTFEHLYNEAASDINILFERSGDDGDTWKDLSVVFGETVTHQIRDPVGCFGEGTSHYLYVSCYNENTDTIWLRRCTDWGAGSWNSEQSLLTLDFDPVYDTLPSIAASATAGTDNVVLVFAAGTLSGFDDIEYLYSENNGESWSGPYTLSGATSSDELAAKVTAHPKGTSFHVTYSDYLHRVFHTKRPQTLATQFETPQRVNRGGQASAGHPEKGLATHWIFDFPYVAWTDFDYDPEGDYAPFFNRLCPDDLVGNWTGQGVYFRTDTDAWKKMSIPAELVAVGDLDGDGTADLAGNYIAQGGIWAELSSTQTWSFLGSSARDIFTGQMDGDAEAELIGTWDGQGVYYKTAVAGSWVKMATPADIIAAGDINGDGIDDLLGVWPGQGGVWVKYSLTSTWERLGSTPRHIGCGDMNGDGRDDLLGTWDGQGVYYRDSSSKKWVKMASPATLIAAGDMDGDNTDDLLGIWPGQGGVWVKYSSTNQWAKLSSTATDIAAGLMRAGGNSWFAQAEEFEPVVLEGPGYGHFNDLSSSGPGGNKFGPASQMNLIPQESGTEALIRTLGPGEPGFRCIEQDNQVPVIVRDDLVRPAVRKERRNSGDK